jgi:hypothetical protein
LVPRFSAPSSPCRRSSQGQTKGKLNNDIRCSVTQSINDKVTEELVQVIAAGESRAAAPILTGHRGTLNEGAPSEIAQGAGASPCWRNVAAAG